MAARAGTTMGALAVVLLCAACLASASTVPPEDTTTTTASFIRTTTKTGDTTEAPHNPNDFSALMAVASVTAGLTLVAVVMIALLKLKRRRHEPAPAPQETKPFLELNALPPNTIAKQLALDDAGFAPIHYAVVQGNHDALLQALSANGSYSLDQVVPSPGNASQPDSPPSADSLYDVEMQGDAKFATQRSPEHVHAVSGFEPTVSPTNCYLNTIVNLPDRGGNTPLIWAVVTNNYAMLSTLLDHGAEVNIGNHKKQTAAHIACMHETDAACLRLVLQHRANLQVVDSEGCTPLSYVCRSGNVAHFDMLDEAQADTNHVDSQKMTPLMVAASRGHIGVVERLFQKRACLLNAKDATGWTAVHWAVAVGELACVEAMVSNKKLSLCVQNARGETPLHIAAREGSLPLVRTLLESRDGSQASSLMAARTDNGLSARDYAVAQGHYDVAQYLHQVESCLEEAPAASTPRFSPPTSPESFSTNNSSEFWPSEQDFSMAMDDQQVPFSGHTSAKRTASGDLKAEEEEEVLHAEAAHEVKKARHREYMRVRRKNERDQLEKMEAKVTILDAENRTLKAAVEALRAEANQLRGDSTTIDVDCDFSHELGALPYTVLWPAAGAGCGDAQEMDC